MDTKLRHRIIDHLKEFISEARLHRIEEVLLNRTNHLTIVLEDLHKSHNANAVLRSADCFGIQDIHVIENQNEFDTESTVSLGAHQWLTIERYNEQKSNNVDACFKRLNENGYTIIATTPHEQDLSIYELDVTKKIALVFGTELDGISEEVRNKVDGFVKIPMYGFSESFNISVSAAIMMFELSKKIRSSDLDWKLNDEYKLALKHQWIKKTIKAGEQIEQKFISELTQEQK